MAQMAERHLNATAASLLGFLHERPMSGYELATTAAEVIGDFWTLTQSQVYRELAWMDDAGLVTAGERGPRDRRPFAVTDAGREAFARWVSIPPGAETIRHPLLLTLSFGRHLPPARLAAFIRRHRDEHIERLRAYELEAREAEAHAEPDRDPYRAATLAFGITYERATLAWFDALPASLIGADDLSPQGSAVPAASSAPPTDGS
jgi:DNA-binding PadR family transcriptional regulator